MKARVWSEVGWGGRYWEYEVLDPARPSGARLRVTGARRTWAEALEAAGEWFK